MTNKEMVKLIQSGENDLFPALWKQNIGLTHRLINRYGNIIERNCAVSRDDMEQVCYFGMRDAVAKFDDRGAKFTTIYGWCAHRSMQAHLGTTHGLDGVEYNTLSLNTPMSEDDETEFLDTVVDETLEDIADTITRRDVARIVREEVDKLQPDQRRFITLMYFEGYTQQEAGLAMGLASENDARNLQNRAINYLKRNPRLKALVEYDYRKRRECKRRHRWASWRYYDNIRGCGLQSFKEHGASVVERAVIDAM